MLALRIVVTLTLIHCIESSNFCTSPECDCRERRAYCINIPKEIDHDLDINWYDYYFNHVWIRSDCTKYEKLQRYFKSLTTFECGNMSHVITLINSLKRRIRSLESTKCETKSSKNYTVHSLKNELHRLKVSKSELETDMSDKLSTPKCFEYANFSFVGIIIMVFAIFAGWSVKNALWKSTLTPTYPSATALVSWQNLGGYG